MTDKKPKDEIGLLRENLKFFLFDRVENTIEEQKEIEEVSIDIFDKAVKIAKEQGKLAGKKELVDAILKLDNVFFNAWGIDDCKKWLKSQLKEAKK
jgi:hypothetical protein